MRRLKANSTLHKISHQLYCTNCLRRCSVSHTQDDDHLLMMGSTQMMKKQYNFTSFISMIIKPNLGMSSFQNIFWSGIWVEADYNFLQ